GRAGRGPRDPGGAPGLEPQREPAGELLRGPDRDPQRSLAGRPGAGRRLQPGARRRRPSPEGRSGRRAPALEGDLRRAHGAPWPDPARRVDEGRDRRLRGGAQGMTALHYRTATELLRALRARELSARELLDHFAARVERVNPRVNAVVATNLEAARARARGADEIGRASCRERVEISGGD